MANRSPEMKQRFAMTISLSPNSLPQGVPARGIPAGIGGKATRSGEKRDAGSLCEFYIQHEAENQ
jgi:hypothetical protein